MKITMKEVELEHKLSACWVFSRESHPTATCNTIHITNTHCVSIEVSQPRSPRKLYLTASTCLSRDHHRPITVTTVTHVPPRGV